MKPVRIDIEACQPGTSIVYNFASARKIERPLAFSLWSLRMSLTRRF